MRHIIIKTLFKTFIVVIPKKDGQVTWYDITLKKDFVALHSMSRTKMIMKINLKIFRCKPDCLCELNIVACQRGGVCKEPPWLQAATRHGPLTLTY